MTKSVVFLKYFSVCLLLSCTPAEKQRAVADGQLFCRAATADGPVVVALADELGAPVIVTGLAAKTVAADCAAICAVPVPPPDSPGAAKTVSARLSVQPTAPDLQCRGGSP
jgi:hypothetical protein